MLRSYFLSTIRTFRKYRVFTFINLIGITLGMSSFILIMKYVSNELSYDQSHTKKDRIYRVQLDRYNQGELSTQWAAGCAGVGPAMLESFPEVDRFVKMHSSNAMISFGEKVFREDHFFYASEEFFRVFDFKLLQGIDSLVLQEPFTAVLSASTAKKYFGEEDPLGKTIIHNGSNSFRITGIFEDVPENSHMKFDCLLSFETYISLTSPQARNSFDWDGFYTYVLLKEGADGKFLESKLPSMVNQYAGEPMKEFGMNMIFHLQPLTDIHLNSNYMREFEANGDLQIVYFLSIVSFFILIIAWVNYINLSTSMAINRMKEIGIRKIIGAQRSQLITQFVFESFILNLFAIFFSVGLAYLLLPELNEIAGRRLILFNGTDLDLWGKVLLLFVAGGIVAGIYPAFVISSFKPSQVLKGRSTKSSAGNIMRRFLVVFQFAISVILIIGTFVVFHQLQFLKQQELGMNIDQTLVIVGPNVTDSTFISKHENFKVEASRLPYVSAIAASTTVPGSQPPWNAGGIRKLEDDPVKGQQYRIIGMDEDYIDYYGLSILEGRKFSADYSNESQSVIFNESAIKLMGFEMMEDAINRKIYFWGDTFAIVGVVKDFHQESLKKSTEPLILRYFSNISSFYSIKVSAGHYQKAVTGMEELFKTFFPGNEYDYFFLDDHFDQQYKSELLFGKIFSSFSTLSIVIACLGLFGLTGFVTTLRTREIGIRKTLGASRNELIILLSTEFSKLVFMAWIPAIPLVWWLSNRWLADFAYKVNLSWWLFAGPGLLILMIALATISYHTLKISSLNPTETLRTE